MPIEAKVTGASQITATVGESVIDVSVGGGVGPTGSQGSSGVVSVSAPLVNGGSASAAQLSLSVGAGLQVSGGSLALASHTHTASQITDFNAAVVAAAPPTTNASLLTSGTLSASRLPIASAGSLGGVRIGSGISIDGSGVISASSGYTLPTASANTLGGVKIGSGITITDGVISVSSASVAWNDITSKPSTFAPSAHAASHAAGGADQLFDQGLSTTDSPAFAGASFPNGVNVGSAQIFSNVYGFAVTVGSETVFKAGPAWIAVTRPIFFEGPNAETARSQTRADLGLGALATKSSVEWGSDITGVPGTFTPSSHTHGSITNAGAIGTTSGLVITTGASGVLGTLAMGTAGQVLKINSGATGVEWGSEEVVEHATAANFPATGSVSILYVATDDSRVYRWTGSQYVEVGPVATYPATHTHDGSEITSGKISVSRLPITSGTAAPTGGADGDIYLQYT